MPINYRATFREDLISLSHYPAFWITAALLLTIGLTASIAGYKKFTRTQVIPALKQPTNSALHPN